MYSFIILFLLSLTVAGWIASSGFAFRYYWKFLVPSLAVIGIGLAFRIQHWPYHTLVLLVGTGGFLLTYLVAAARKPRFYLLDYIKIGWTLIAAGQLIVHVMYWPFAQQGRIALICATVILAIVYILFPVHKQSMNAPAYADDLLDWEEDKDPGT